MQVPPRCHPLGPGELRLAAAAIACSDMDANPSRIAARGGIGTVLASKELKAIVVENPERRATLPPAISATMTAEKGGCVTNHLNKGRGFTATPDEPTITMVWKRARHSHIKSSDGKSRTKC